MNAREKGFLLLTCWLGSPERQVLTPAQLRKLSERVRLMPPPEEDRQLLPEDMVALGYDRESANRIVALLEEEALMELYLQKAKRAGCAPITRVSPGYPAQLRRRLGEDAPASLWAKGDVTLLDTPMVALVGSRELREENRSFAEEVGKQAALQGYTLVSGNARGSDKTAQNACLRHGGSVISVVADELASHTVRENVLWLSEDAFDAPFSTLRALRRNRVIHSLGQMTFVAQANLQQGGTWDGTSKNLRFGWSPVYGFRDGSDAMQVLEQMGAQLITSEQLRDFSLLPTTEKSLFDQ